MIIKEALIPSEKKRITAFLQEFGLKYERQIDSTLYIEFDGEIVATVSTCKYIIKCLAVNLDYRSENLAGVLVSEVIKRFHEEDIFYYQVFTKPEYCNVFISLGFRPLIQTDKVTVLEGGDGDIHETIQAMKVQMKYSLGADSVERGCDIGCVVINGNPFTNGHVKLVEYAAAKHKYVLVFVLEEEGSYFTFKERYTMAYLALKPYSNVLVIPSSKYIISKATFPGYFLKTVDRTTREYALYDALIFLEYFMPLLNIKKRYVGEEVKRYMRIYNQTLGMVLGDKIEVVERFKEDDEVISASKFRELIKEGKRDEAFQLIPRTNYAVMSGILSGNNGRFRKNTCRPRSKK